MKAVFPLAGFQGGWDMKLEVYRCDSEGCKAEILSAIVDGGNDHGWFALVGDVAGKGEEEKHYCSVEHLQKAAAAVPLKKKDG